MERHPMNAKKKDDPDRTITVGGVEVVIPLPIEVSNVGTEELPGQILLYGQYLASAEEQKILIDTEYRQWRAIYSGSLLSRDRKISEWRIRNKRESEPEFLKFKTGQALAAKHVLILRAVCDSLRARVDVVCWGAPIASE